MTQVTEEVFYVGDYGAGRNVGCLNVYDVLTKVGQRRSRDAVVAPHRAAWQ